MIGNNPLIQSHGIVSSSAAVGVTLPAAVLEAQERAAKVVAGVQHAYPREGLAQPVYEALMAGNDPAADALVQRAYIAMQIGSPGIAQQVEALAAEDIRQAFSAHADAMITAWRQPFDDAAAVLKDGLQRLGPVSLSDTTEVLDQGGDAAEVWSNVQAALTTLNTITAAWAQLGEVTRLVNPNPNYPALKLTAVSAQTWREQELTRKRLGPWDAIKAGHKLSLPTFAEYAQRVRDLERDTAAMRMAEQPVDTQRDGVRDFVGRMDRARAASKS